MITIQNISKKYSKTDWQEYEIKINSRVICKFKHKASNGLAKCLAEASEAVYEAKQKSQIEKTKNETDKILMSFSKEGYNKNKGSI
jgi:predicted DNA-binding protein (UPF0278 family)